MTFDFVNLLAHVVLICTLATILFSVAAYAASRRRTRRPRKPAAAPAAAPSPPPPPAATITRLHKASTPDGEGKR
ncbi:MAG: hypothetical protein U1F77_00100 [Kiritimatiellia bacterium]